MNSYDIAAGVTQTALNSLLGQLYGNSSVRNGLFKASLTRSLTGLGDVTVTYDVKATPTVVLLPPTGAQWLASQRQDPSVNTPPASTIQIVLSDIAVSATVGAAPPLAAEGPVTFYACITETAEQAVIAVLALLIDESSFSSWDKLIVNDILIPQLFTLAAGLIPAIPIPQLPVVEGVSFQPLSVAVSSSGVLIGSTMTGGGTTDLSGFMWPTPAIFAAAKLNPINRLLATTVSGPYHEEDSTGPSGWTASAGVTASNVKMSVSTTGSDVVMTIAGHFAVYGELSGTGVGVTKALLCPIGAAMDAIADPGKWDKVISSFDLKYSPNPMPVVAQFTAAAPAGSPLTQAVVAKVPNDKLPSSISIIVAPTWSGSVTGTVLAAAAAAFVDLISVIFGKLIIKDLVGRYGSASFSLPAAKMIKTISLPEHASVTVAAAAAVGSALQAAGDQLIQPLQITVS